MAKKIYDSNVPDRINTRIGNSECFAFGSTNGCSPDCPVFQRGECELYEENLATFKADGTYDFELSILGLI